MTRPHRIQWAISCFVLVCNVPLSVGEPDASLELPKVIDHDASFLLSASGTIFSGKNYSIVAAVFNSSEICRCVVELTGPGLNMSVDINLTPMYPISDYTFKLPELKQGDYYLKVVGTEGVDFERTTKLNWFYFKSFIKIQTPKSNYRPGELMQFRVIYHNEYMHSVEPDNNANIWITDSKNNIMRSYRDIDVIKGVFQSQIQLGQFPNLGLWKICAKNGKSVTQTCVSIHVWDYQLPTFNIRIDSPNIVYKKDEVIPVTVYAKYPIDIPVEGAVVMELKRIVKIGKKSWTQRENATLKNGECSFNMSFTQLKTRTANNKQVKIRLTAIVTEITEEKREIANKIVTLVADADDPDEQDAVTYFETDIDSNDKKVPKYLPAISVPDKWELRRLKNNKFKIERGTPKKTPEKINFQFDYDFKYAFCVIMFNGLIVHSARVYPFPPRVFNLEITFSENMWPNANIFMYGMETNSSVLHVATQTIKLMRRAHKVTDADVPASVKPGQEITLRFKAVPTSYLGFLAVDSRVHQLDDTPINDFDEDYFHIINTLKASPPTDLELGADLMASKLGLVTLTTAKFVGEGTKGITPRTKQLKDVNKSEEASDTSHEEMEDIPLISHDVEMENHINNARSPKTSTNKPVGNKNTINVKSCCAPPPKNETFNNIWVFDRSLSTTTGWMSWKVKVPNDTTDWKLTTFTVDPTAGITLMEPKYFKIITSKKPMYLISKVPYRIRVDELLLLTVKVFNQLDKSINVTILTQQDTSSFRLLDKDQNELPETKYVENKIYVSKLNYTTVSFYLRALIPGNVKLQFKATSGSMKDVLEHDIKVLPDSLLFSHHMFSYKKLASPEKQSNFTLKLKHPHSIDGVKCYITSKTIILQLHSFRPFQLIDNAEQIISKLISVYYLYDYVRVIDTRASQKWMNYLEDNLNDGFQSLLRFRIPKEGFRYDNLTENGCSSTWLTGFALQALTLLKETPVEIDENIITETEDFLLSRRKNSTEFWEPCRIPNRRKMDRLELSIEILKTLQNSTRFLNLQSTNNWISKELAMNNNIHLNAKRGASLPTWKAPVWVNPENWTVERRDLETAGRILTMQLKREVEPENVLYIWILAKLFGKPIDCYECSIAEQAIYHRTKMLMDPETHKIKVSVYGDDIKQQKIFDLDNHEEVMLQKVSLQTKENVINFQATGLGQLLVRCSYEYEIKVTEKSATNRYQIRIKQLYSKSLPIHQIKLMVCICRNRIDRLSYVGTEVTVDLPSGYTLDSESVYQLSLKPQVRMASSENKGTQLRVSVEAPATKFVCGTANCQRDYNVLNLKPGLISAYDTYSDHDPEVFPFELNLDSPSTFNESTTSDADNENPTTPTFNESTTSDADNEIPTTPTFNESTTSDADNENRTTPTFNESTTSDADNENSTTPTFNESTTSDADNESPTTPTFNESTTSDADNESPTTPTFDLETSTESLSTPFTLYDVLKVFSNLIDQLSSSVSTTENIDFHTRFKRTIDDSNDIAALLAASDSNSDYSTAV